MAFEKGLGRGLDSLIPKTNLAAGRAILNIDVDQVIPNPRQPRNNFSEKSLLELISSIQQQGVIQPIIVRRRGDVYEIVAGERRWRAAQKAGLKAVPGIVKEVTDEESLESALIENIQRENLNPLDEAEAYENLITEFGLTQDQIAQKIGRSRSSIANILRLLSLPSEVQESIRSNKISAGHARSLLSLAKTSWIIPVWKEIIEKRLSVRDTEFLVTRKNKNVSRETIREKSPKKVVFSDWLADLSEKLTQILATKVTAKGKKQRGKIIISYYSFEDLERLTSLLLKLNK